MLERAIRKGAPERVAELSAQLEMPPFPEGLDHVWRAFQRLRRRKAAGENGPAPLEFKDIEAFIRITRERLAPWEVSLIEALDDTYLVASHEAIREASAPPPDGEIARKKVRRSADG